LDYPTKPITLVVPFPAGGGNDALARLVAEKMSRALGQQVVVENRGGAGGTIATRAVAKTAPDGNTILLTYTGTLAINPTLYPNAGYDPRKDFAPIGLIGSLPSVLVVHPSLPVHSVTELIAYAKANPGKLSIASYGAGTISQVAAALFTSMAAINMVQVPYRGSAPALTDLLGGQVQAMFASMPSAIEYIRAGKLRALAVSTASASEQLPDVPPVADVVPAFEASGWYGVGAPRYTPPEIVAQLNREINAALADPKLKARLADAGGVMLTGSPADLGRVIAAETEKWDKVIRAANIKAE
jgi:tripartite-type tricarboxylate transporter receptor subunit TctC